MPSPANSRLLGLCLILAVAPASVAQTTYRWIGADGKVNYSDRPPPPDARKVEQKQLGAPNIIESSGPGYSTRVAAQAAPVTLYSSADCAAECKNGREFLKRLGVPHTEKILKTTDDAAAYSKATGSEELLVPTLLVGSVTQKGFEAGAWRRLLEAAGYPLAEAATPQR